MIYILTIALVSLVGLILVGLAYFLSKKLNPVYTSASFIGSVLISLVIVFWGWNIMKGAKLAFQEYWNGYELTASVQTFVCERDGSCAREYSCDPYTVLVTTYSTDSKGNVTSSIHAETHYHSCPYATKEFTYTVDTTLGNYVIASHIFDDAPIPWRNTAVPGDVARGAPQFWTDAAARIASGKPGPVTKKMTYDNYILASDKTILNQYSDKIQEFIDKKELPPVTSDIYSYYYANKAHFIGLPENPAWQTSLAYLNSFLGSELQGDLHLVLVNDYNVTSQPDAYLLALKAYWSNPQIFGDKTISKNGIIVVIGTDGQKVTWARAISGMPLGNEYMLHQIASRLPGTAFTPESVLGITSSSFYVKDGKTKVKGTHGSGVLEGILWGIPDPATKFARVSMSGGQPGDNGSGFAYLDSQIEPDTLGQVILLIMSVIITLLIVGGTIWYQIEQERNADRYTKYIY